MSASEADLSNPWLDLLSLINGFQITQAIHVASTLRIADHLTDGARSADELAALTHSHPTRSIACCVRWRQWGFSGKTKAGKFTLTPMGDCLRSDSATPIGAWAEVVGSPYFWQTWGHLLHSVRTGENAFQDLNGQDVWKFRAEHPDDGATFNRAMTQFSRGHAESVIGAYDFSAFRRIVDVGGGQGLMLAAILGAHPRLHGTLFDQPGRCRRRQGGAGGTRCHRPVRCRGRKFLRSGT